MNYVFSSAPQAVVPIAGSELFFPVRRVYCVGQNYAEYSVEIGVDTREPISFLASRQMCWYPKAARWRIRR